MQARRRKPPGCLQTLWAACLWFQVYMPHCPFLIAMQSSSFPGFPSTENVDPQTLSGASTSSPTASPRTRPQPQPPARARGRPNDDALATRLEALTLAFNDLRQAHNKLCQDQMDLQARMVDLECTAGRVDAAFGQLSSLHSVVQGRDTGNFRSRAGPGRGGDRALDRGFDRGTPPPGRFNNSRGRGGRF